MVNIPVKFTRMAAAFDEMARDKSYESSGSEHSADLSDLVNSFLEREISDRKINEDADDEDVGVDEINGGDRAESYNISPDQIEFRDDLKKLFDPRNDVVKGSIHAEVEVALDEVAGERSSPPEFKRRLMAQLRSRGFDAGLCKSKWEKNGRNPSGNYEYIDVNSGDSRYIVEVHLAGEFTIARPTQTYASLLEHFPRIFVGTADELKQVVRLMSKAIRKSMKSVDLNVPPWRRLAYMQAKWFGCYKRTVNETSTKKAAVYEGLAGNRLVGFAPTTKGSSSSSSLSSSTTSFYCRGDFGAKRSGVRIGNLALALN